MEPAGIVFFERTRSPDPSGSGDDRRDVPRIARTDVAEDGEKDVMDIIDFAIRTGDPLQTACDAVMIGVAAGEGDRPALVSRLDSTMHGELGSLLRDAGFAGQVGRRFMTPTLGAVAPRRVVLVGTGPEGGDADARRRS